MMTPSEYDHLLVLYDESIRCRRRYLDFKNRSPLHEVDYFLMEHYHATSAKMSRELGSLIDRYVNGAFNELVAKVGGRKNIRQFEPRDRSIIFCPSIAEDTWNRLK